jgi:hypothetical protein
MNSFDRASREVFRGLPNLNKDSLQALATESDNLRQFLHFASVLGRRNDPLHQEVYTKEMCEKLSR